MIDRDSRLLANSISELLDRLGSIQVIRRTNDGFREVWRKLYILRTRIAL